MVNTNFFFDFTLFQLAIEYTIYLKRTAFKYKYDLIGNRDVPIQLVNMFKIINHAMKQVSINLILSLKRKCLRFKLLKLNCFTVQYDYLVLEKNKQFNLNKNANKSFELLLKIIFIQLHTQTPNQLQNSAFNLFKPTNLPQNLQNNQNDFFKPGKFFKLVTIFYYFYYLEKSIV